MEILIKDIIDQGISILKEAQVLDAENDSWLLAEHVFGITRATFYMNPKSVIDEHQAKRFLALIKKRSDKIPLQYITGVQEFMGFPFKVNENVLIPRQDTELLVEKAVEYIHMQRKTVKVLDMCTGSGCIAISVDKLCPMAEVTGADISYKALALARENSDKNNAEVNFIQSDLFKNIEEKFDVIISNPPYIKTGEIDTLMEEVKDYEPIIALDGDNDGLKFYRLISKKLNFYLNDKGKIMFEIGYDQGDAVPEILNRYGLKDIKVHKDLSGHDRVVIAGKE
ncbi:MAG: peptide chain release factor N(5)-glutamine methyltransferase [Eubacterium sp.]